MAAKPEDPELAKKRDFVEHCYREYRSAVRRFIGRRLLRPAQVEDLVHEVYERLLRYRSKQPIRSAKAYIFQLTRRVLHDANLSISVEKGCVSFNSAELESQIEGGAQPLWFQDESGRVMDREELEHVLNQLPPNYRTALLRRCRDGWTYKAIAAELGVSTHTIKYYLGKTFCHVRLHFLKYGR